eukprot:Trichotokara_eunicae@DN11115_c0_g1_i1.p1
MVDVGLVDNAFNYLNDATEGALRRDTTATRKANEGGPAGGAGDWLPQWDAMKTQSVLSYSLSTLKIPEEIRKATQKIKYPEGSNPTLGSLNKNIKVSSLLCGIFEEFN